MELEGVQLGRVYGTEGVQLGRVYGAGRGRARKGIWSWKGYS